MVTVTDSLPTFLRLSPLSVTTFSKVTSAERIHFSVAAALPSTTLVKMQFIYKLYPETFWQEPATFLIFRTSNWAKKTIWKNGNHMNTLVAVLLWQSSRMDHYSLGGRQDNIIAMSLPFIVLHKYTLTESYLFHQCWPCKLVSHQCNTPKRKVTVCRRVKCHHFCLVHPASLM